MMKMNITCGLSVWLKALRDTDDPSLDHAFPSVVNESVVIFISELAN
jgi:hypothetical protein